MGSKRLNKNQKCGIAFSEMVASNMRVTMVAVGKA